MALLFSYGSLQSESVQQAIFGRPLKAQPDEVIGVEPAVVRVDDPAGRATTHLNLTFGGRDRRMKGMVFEVSEADLAAADRYEATAGYVRVRVTLASGRDAWVYVDGRSSPAAP